MKLKKWQKVLLAVGMGVFLFLYILGGSLVSHEVGKSLATERAARMTLIPDQDRNSQTRVEKISIIVTLILVSILLALVGTFWWIVRPKN